MKRLISYLFINLIDLLKRFDRVQMTDPVMNETVGGVRRRAIIMAIDEETQK